MRSVVVLTIVASVAVLGGCSPGLGTSLAVGRIPLPATLGGGGGSAVRIQSVIDGRPARTIGVVGDRAIRAEGDVPGKVQVALGEFLKANGFRLSAGESAVLRGTVLDWNVVVVPGFPASVVEGTAMVELEAFGPDSSSRYVRRYTGSATTKHPFMTSAHVQDTLGEAMGYALQAAMEDERLLSHLRQSVPAMVPWQ
jgi:uncharacterized lipoprotein YajG